MYLYMFICLYACMYNILNLLHHFTFEQLFSLLGCSLITCVFGHCCRSSHLLSLSKSTIDNYIRRMSCHMTFQSNSSSIWCMYRIHLMTLLLPCVPMFSAIYVYQNIWKVIIIHALHLNVKNNLVPRSLFPKLVQQLSLWWSWWQSYEFSVHSEFNSFVEWVEFILNQSCSSNSVGTL